MLRTSQIVQLIVMALLGLGLVMVLSAGMNVGRDRSDPVALLMERNSLYALIAVVGMLIASRVNVRRIMEVRGLANPAIWLVIVSLTLVALTMVPGVGRSVNGASRWLPLGPPSLGLQFQPSEMVKFVMVLAVAWWCARRRGVMHRFFHGLFPPLLLVTAGCGLIVLEDLGTATLVGAVACCLLLAGGARWWQMALMAPPAIGTVIAAIIQSPYRMARLTAFMNPWADPQGIGYHPIQSMLAIAQGGITGRGLGNGIQKFGYLPEDTTDFIFAIICEELGLAGGAMVVALYLALLWFGLGVAKNCKDVFGRLVALGVLITVGFQALINIAVVTVVVPTKGIALPLISSGGTGWILTAVALGLVASLDEANRIMEPNLEIDEEASLATDLDAATPPEAAA